MLGKFHAAPCLPLPHPVCAEGSGAGADGVFSENDAAADRSLGAGRVLPAGSLTGKDVVKSVFEWVALGKSNTQVLEIGGLYFLKA